MTDAKTLHFGVFEVTAPQVGGTFSWAHPRSRSADFLDPQHWIHIARVLEDAGFDFLFFAGGYGYPLVDADLPEIAATKGINLAEQATGGWTLGQIAAAKGHLSVLEFLPTQGVDLAVKDQGGVTLGHYVARAMALVVFYAIIS